MSALGPEMYFLVLLARAKVEKEERRKQKGRNQINYIYLKYV